jgi:hypothetical protein
MRKLITIPLILFNLICSATNYYVKNTGSDANTGLSDGQAWQTINKINTSTFSAGDTIFFNKGDTWRETLTVPSSGTSGAYIVFSSYGTGDKPQILGSEFEDTWTHGDIAGQAANNDLLDESFEGAGYEHSWAETIGANESNIVDQDNTDVARPAGGGAQILKIVKDITPTATATASRAITIYDIGSIEPSVYVDFYVQINANGLTNPADEVKLCTLSGGSLITGMLSLINSSGNIKFTYNDSNYPYALYPTAGGITLDQWYHIQMSYDNINGTYSCLIDGNYVYGGIISGTPSTGTQYITLGSASDIFTLTAYYDLINVSSTNFYSATITIPDDVWVSDGTYTNPYIIPYNGNVFYKETSGSITWGLTQRASLLDLTEEYEWTWIADKICIYSSTDPNTHYDGVEVAQRLSCIHLNSEHYLGFNDLEIAYSGRYGIVCATDFPYAELAGLSIQNCNIHHFGSKLGVGGYCLSIWYSDMLIKNNIIHDGSRRLTSMYVYTQVIFPHNVIIEDNIFYDGFHTSGVDINTAGTGGWDSVIIRSNLFYQNSNPIDVVENPEGENIFVAEQGSTGTQTKIYIYNNIFKSPNNYSMLFEHVTSAYVYNNTFYCGNQNLVDPNKGFLGISGAGSVTLKNNIFYNDIANATVYPFRCISISATSGTVACDYNLYYCIDPTQSLITWRGTTYLPAQWATYRTASGQDANSLTPTDPLFYSSTNNGLQIGSPAIGAGENLGLITDYTGHYWNNPPSLGALEYGSTITPLLRKETQLLRTSSGNLIRQ